MPAGESTLFIQLFTQVGMGGLLLWYVVRRLDKIQDTLADNIRLYTILITSLPDVKRRSKDDAEAINKRINGEK